MALTSIKRTSNRNPASFATRGKEPQNDFLFAVRKSGEGSKDEFTVSDDFLENSGVQDANLGADILFDNDTNKVYLGIVSKENATVLKGRAGTSKGTSFQHKDAVAELEKIGSISTTRGIGYGSAFSLVQVSADMLPGATALYEIVPAELVGTAKRAMNKFQGVEETPATETPSAPVESAPVATEAVAQPAAEVDEWDS